MPDSALFDAIEIAARAHRHQFRKGTGVPYLVHPLRVATRLIQAGAPSACVVAAVLHDVLEDTSTSADQLRDHFDEEIVAIVVAVTEAMPRDPWEARKRATIAGLGSAPESVLWVACGDKLDNVTSMTAGCRRDGEPFWERFHRPRDHQAWYYREVAGVLSQRARDPGLRGLTRELAERVEVLFGVGD